MAEPATTTETRTDASQPVTPQRTVEERIRIRAYELYEKRNGDVGDAESDWYRAETEIKSEVAVPAK